MRAARDRGTARAKVAEPASDDVADAIDAQSYAETD
jgi:hypothetical protein